MESKVCVVGNPKRNHSDNEDDGRESKQSRWHSSRDRHSDREKYDKSGGRKYQKLKVGDPYYSGGTLTGNVESEDRYKDESKRSRKIRSGDHHEKENKSRNEDEKIGAPYYSGGGAVMERESGEELSDFEDDKVGQRYYSTGSTKDKKQNVCTNCLGIQN